MIWRNGFSGRASAGAARVVMGLAGLLAAAVSSPGHAAEVCVHDDIGFAAAAGEAQFIPLTIKLVQGTYHYDNTAFDGIL